MWCLLVYLACCYVAMASTKSSGGMSGKFLNLSRRKAKLYWLGPEGPQLNAVVEGNGGIISFQTYAGHSFMWGAYNTQGKKPEPLRSQSVKGAEFTIRDDQLIYALIDETTQPKLLEAHQKEVDFLTNYRAKTGRDWLANYPRDPPILSMRKCVNIGEQIQVPIKQDAQKFLCGDGTDACRAKEPTITIECISVTPCAWSIKEFLSDYEADEIKKHAEPGMQRSGLMGGAENMEDTQRTSTSYRMNRHTLKEVDAIYRRAAHALDLPQHIMENDRVAEPLDVLRYLDNQHYQPHFDWYVTGVPESRFVSFLMYLNTPPAGGATNFPNAGSDGVAIKAIKRNAFFFYNMLEDGNVDDYSLHEGQPVVVGPKWLATIWVWDPKQSGHKEVTKKEMDAYRAAQELEKAEL